MRQDASDSLPAEQHRGRQNPMGRWELVTRIFGMDAARIQSDDNPFDRQIRIVPGRLKRSLRIDFLGRSRPDTVPYLNAGRNNGDLVLSHAPGCGLMRPCSSEATGSDAAPSNFR